MTGIYGYQAPEAQQPRSPAYHFGAAEAARHPEPARSPPWRLSTVGPRAATQGRQEAAAARNETSRRCSSLVLTATLLSGLAPPAAAQTAAASEVYRWLAPDAAA
ncbi:MAG: hypothetical protein OXG35_17280 [Acidobacteria bacterium]|nr:hypothetical protein [Acidobacteriota bacterium]